MPITLLITGFGPFPGAPVNPSGALAERLTRMRRPSFADEQRIAHVFATSYAAIEREWPELMKQHRPDAVLMFGLAGRTRHLRIETRAQNFMTSLAPDAERRKPATRRFSSGPSWRTVRAPAPQMLTAARSRRAPVVMSHDAGAYLCNALFWRALESAGGHRPRVAAFIHVPRQRVLPLTKLVPAAEAILRVILATARRPH